jgi:hypothetical protein
VLVPICIPRVSTAVMGATKNTEGHSFHIPIRLKVKAVAVFKFSRIKKIKARHRFLCGGFYFYKKYNLHYIHHIHQNLKIPF